MSAKARKRAAVAEVRELAASLGVSVSREKTDLKEPEFAALQREVRGHCNSPAHEAALERAWKRYKGEEVEEEAVPTAAVPEAASAASQLPRSSRLRGTSCLFTYNSAAFAQVSLDALWARAPRVGISRFRESPGTANIGGGNLQESPGTPPGTANIGSGNLQDFPGTLPGPANLGSGNLHPVCNLKF